MWAFFMALGGASCIGTMKSLGEVNMLGYTKIFPPKLIGAFGTGIGISGPLASGFYLALIYASVPTLVVNKILLLK